jgi:hypothetical protein
VLAFKWRTAVPGVTISISSVTVLQGREKNRTIEERRCVLSYLPEYKMSIFSIFAFEKLGIIAY